MKSKTPARVPPTESELRALLGESFAAYEALLAGHADLRPEWKYYGPKSGWTLKLFDGRKAPFFAAAANVLVPPSGLP